MRTSNMPIDFAHPSGSARRAAAGLLLAATTLTAQPRPAAAACEMRVLYDAAKDARPDARRDGLAFAGLGVFTQTVGASRAVLDSAENLRAQAGYIYIGKNLERDAGITLTFDVALLAERHNSPHRAGLSVIVLGADKRGIELGFWPRRIWAQLGGKAPRLFTAAEGAVVDTRRPRRYSLRVNGDAYMLSADGKILLRGAVRDYTAFDRFPDVYETPGYVFLGDNSASAGARVALGYVALGTGACPQAESVAHVFANQKSRALAAKPAGSARGHPDGVALQGAAATP